MTNWFDPTHLSVRFVLIVCMLARFLMATAIPDAFGERTALFAGGTSAAVGSQHVRGACDG
jgi:low temperature requirement protein LtrA